MSESVLLRFADEEMIYLLRSLRLTDFPGLDPEPLKEMADNEKSLLMMTADHTLRARQLVQWRGETEREIDPLVTKVLLECARPRYTLFMDTMDTRAAAVKLLYIFGSERIVEQSETEPHVQQYLVMPSSDELLQRLHGLIVNQQAETSVALPTGRISQDLWMEAVKVARVDEAQASVLLARSLPAQTAAVLAAAVHDLRRIQYLALWKQTPAVGQRAPEASLTVVAGRGQIILLRSEGRPATRSLTVVPASVELVWEHVSRLIAVTR